jgi:hypothetical protein
MVQLSAGHRVGGIEHGRSQAPKLFATARGRAPSDIWGNVRCYGRAFFERRGGRQ